MPRGGRRANAGRKLAPETIAFREFWRSWFESAEGRRHLLQRAKHSDALLAKLIDKVYPSPQAVKIETENNGPLVVMMGATPEEHYKNMAGMGYKPMGRVLEIENSTVRPNHED